MITWLAVAHAGCEPVPLEVLRARLDAAEGAFASLDRAGFQDALDDAALRLPCLAELLPPADAARWHGLVALQHYGGQRDDDLAASLASARAAVPGWTFPDTWVPPGHELREARPAAPGATIPAPPPSDGATWFDGARSVERPAERPTVFQWARGDGTVGATAYLVPGAALPGYPTADPPPVDAPPVATARRRRPALAFVAAGVGAAAAVTCSAAAAAGRGRFDGELPPSVDGDGLLALRSQVNALTAGAWVSGGVAVGAAAAGGVAWARR